MAQRDRPESLLGLVQRLIRMRRACPEIGWGETQVLETGSEAVLALVCAWRGDRIVTLHNLAPEPVSVRVNIPDAEFLSRLINGGDDCDVVRIGESIELGRYGYSWFRIDGERR